MNETEIEQTIEQIRELHRASAAATNAAESMERRLANAGIEFTHHLTHTSWKRTRPSSKVIDG